ncbi:beta-lactamase family protein [Candidatus Poribacteria bacterium]|nr:beta-lactamase family protein [Candidatus Poribacteria bacterium]
MKPCNTTRKPGNQGIDQLIRYGISENIFPGAVVYIADSATFPYCEAFGCRMRIPEVKPMQRDTIFDLASLTKPIVIATLIMRYVEAGAVELNESIQSYLPEFSHSQVTISHLLTHTSGLPAWRATYLESENSYGVVNYLSRIPLDYLTGTQVVYSCLGYILLGKLLERLTDEPLDALAQKWIFQPLEMNWTRYNPPSAWTDKCAATEDSNSFEKRMVDYQPHDWREGIIVGEVHDENAHFLGGVSGNAGLFSTATDIGKFCQMLLNGGHSVLTTESIDEMASAQTAGLNESRSFGWIILEDGSLYHTGFTGTSVRINLERKMYAILLTNRVHPDASRTGIVDFRAKFHQSIFSL